MSTRAAVFKDPDWLAFVAKGAGAIVEMHSTLLLLIDFSRNPGKTPGNGMT